MGSNPVGVEVEAGFLPLNFVLYFCRVRIEVDGTVHSRPWGTHFFPLASGEHLISVSYRYLGMNRCGFSRLRVSLPEGHCVRLRYYFWKPWVFASGSLKQESATQVVDHSNRREGPVKACPRCAEDVRVEARVCRHCGYEFAEADVAQAIAQGQAAEAASREARQRAHVAEEIAVSQRREYKRSQQAIVFTILFAQLGLVMPPMILADMEQTARTSEPPPGAIPVMVVTSLVLFGALAVWQWLRAKRIRAALRERMATEGNYADCVCGEPIKPYYWLHYFLCAVVILYGYLSLFFKLKRCRKCGRDYDLPLEVAPSRASLQV